jgi:glyoxylase-like metal-dependent hydrolase (beta-lactamase superfamily II)
MFNKTLAALLMAAATASAQYTLSNETAKPAAGSALTATLVKTGLYTISGGGTNTLLRLSANGLIVVDGKLPGNYDALLKKMRKISDQRVRVLINTDYREEHTGNNARFLADGTQIIAHENVKDTLANYNPPGGKVAPPTITYAKDYEMKIGGVEVRLMHFGNAHTNGDTVVYFPNLKVVAVGDLFASVPDPDFSAGGSLVEWGAVLAQILKLDFDIVVPAAGPAVGRAELEAFKTKLDTLAARATTLASKGVPKDDLMAQIKTDDLGWRFSFSADQLDRFYSELSQRR